MSWLTKQEDGLLRTWIVRTKTPMLVTMPDGSILWCNESFESLLGYSSFELVGKRSWHDLTDDKSDLAAHIALAGDAVAGKRRDFQMHKPYRTKDGPKIRVVIDVVRYPQAGDFECFLVSAVPTDRGVHFALGQLTEIHTLMIEIIGREKENKDRIDAFFAWVSSKPMVGYPIILFFAILLFGSRVAELIKEIFPNIGE